MTEVFWRHRCLTDPATIQKNGRDPSDAFSPISGDPWGVKRWPCCWVIKKEILCTQICYLIPPKGNGISTGIFQWSSKRRIRQVYFFSFTFSCFSLRLGWGEAFSQGEAISNLFQLNPHFVGYNPYLCGLSSHFLHGYRSIYTFLLLELHILLLHPLFLLLEFTFVLVKYPHVCCLTSYESQRWDKLQDHHYPHQSC